MGGARYDPDLTALRNELALRRAAETALFKINRATVRAILLELDIDLITSDYDGEGDSGQLELPAFKVKAKPEPPRTLRTPRLIGEGSWSVTPEPDTASAEEGIWPDVTVTVMTGTGFDDLSLRSAVHELFYDGLRQLTPGWETNEGSFGGVRWEVPTDSMVFDHNHRMLTTLYEEFRL